MAYDGTDFAGFQAQEHPGTHARTVQGVLEASLGVLEGAPVRVAGAGRTDAGVHASGQVIHFDLGAHRPRDVREIGRAVNARLPGDVRVLGVRMAAEGFHARHSARARVYRYYLVNAEVSSPRIRRFGWHVRTRLDVAAMRSAAALLVGSHDFAAFAAREAPGPTRRAVHFADVREVESPLGRGSHYDVTGMWHNLGHADEGVAGCGRLLVVEVEANAFLRHMMRRIVGSLVRVGLGQVPAAEIGVALEQRDKARAGPTAPALGLDLFRVEYGVPFNEPGPDGTARE